MAAVLTKRRPAVRQSHSIVAESATHIAMASTDGEMNAGSMKDWISAMRDMQKRQKNVKEWQEHMSAFLNSCAAWLGTVHTLVDEVAVVQQERTFYLFAVLKKDTEITVELRRYVADFGITMGAVFKIRTEARLTSSRPSNCSTVVEHAHKQTTLD